MTAAATPPTPLAGIYPVLCTPFDPTGLLDLESLDRLVDATLATGCDGLTLGGVASEVYKLADDERCKIVERVLGRLGGRAPVWVGTGHQCTELTIEHSLHAQHCGAAGVMVMPPFVGKPSLKSLTTFFRELDQELAIPIMIQDAPLVSGLHLPVDWMIEVAATCEHVRAVKIEAAPTGPKTVEVVTRAANRLAVFGGLGGQNLVGELRRGAVGTLPGSAFPAVYVDTLQAWRTGDSARAEEIHRRVLPLIRFCSQSVEFSFHAYKEILLARGVIASSYVRRPTSRFDDVAHEELAALLPLLEMK